MSPRSDAAIRRLKMALCLSLMGEHAQSHLFYLAALDCFLSDRHAWLDDSRPDWLVDCAVLAGYPGTRAHVLADLEPYRLDPRGGSLVALRAFAISSLMNREDSAALRPLPGLMRHPEVAWTIGLCRAVRGIVERRQGDFDDGLRELLAAHSGQARLGALPWAPEDYLCLPAMALGKLALDRGLALQVRSEGLAPGYLSYLLRVAAE